VRNVGATFVYTLMFTDLLHADKAKQRQQALEHELRCTPTPSRAASHTEEKSQIKTLQKEYRRNAAPSLASPAQTTEPVLGDGAAAAVIDGSRTPKDVGSTPSSPAGLAQAIEVLRGGTAIPVIGATPGDVGDAPSSSAGLAQATEVLPPWLVSGFRSPVTCCI
jgi:hypothetical protein